MLHSVTQSSLTLCDPKDCSLPGCSVHGIFPARILKHRRSDSLLQWIFLTQGWTRVSCISWIGRQILLPLNHPRLSLIIYNRIKKMWYIYIMEYYSAIKKNEMRPSAATGMYLEIIILSEVKSDIERQIYDTAFMWNLKNRTNEWL